MGRGVEAAFAVEKSTLTDRPGRALRILARGLREVGRVRVDNPVLRVTAYRELRRLIRVYNPDVIWAQLLAPAQLALLQPRVPVVFSHHDWLYKVKALRTGRIPSPTEREWEEGVTRAADAVVSGSALEVQALREIGCQSVTYVPRGVTCPPWDGNAG